MQGPMGSFVALAYERLDLQAQLHVSSDCCCAWSARVISAETVWNGLLYIHVQMIQTQIQIT